MSTIEEILKKAGSLKELLTIIGAIALMLWTGFQYAVKEINLNTSAITKEMWVEHLEKDSVRVAVGVNLASKVLVRQDSTIGAIADLSQSLTLITHRINQLEKKLEPDTVPMNSVARELANLKQMMADAEQQRIKVAEAQARQIIALQKANEQLQPFQTGDRKP